MTAPTGPPAYFTDGRMCADELRSKHSENKTQMKYLVRCILDGSLQRQIRLLRLLHSIDAINRDLIPRNPQMAVKALEAVQVALNKIDAA